MRQLKQRTMLEMSPRMFNEYISLLQLESFGERPRKLEWMNPIWRKSNSRVTTRNETRPKWIHTGLRPFLESSAAGSYTFQLLYQDFRPWLLASPRQAPFQHDQNTQSSNQIMYVPGMHTNHGFLCNLGRTNSRLSLGMWVNSTTLFALIIYSFSSNINTRHN